MSDLLLDEGRWIGRPEQVGAAFSGKKKMAEFMDKRLEEEDEELSATELHQLIVRKFGKKVSTQTIRRFLHQKLHWVVVWT